MSKFNEYKGLNLPNVAKQVLEQWEANKVFEQSVSSRDENKPFVFFEGPPSANGLPGIHHVMARAIKDIFCRYKTLKGYQVKRKAGWDTHGLPVELGVEKELGITKEDIGKKITIEAYNNACKEAVMRYTDVWNNLTKQMGYWVDMDDPYITYENKYIESVWWLLGQLHQKGLMYKGYTIQPYSPKAGTGLSSHELNQPGCYKDVKDTTCVAQFKVKRNEKSEFLFSSDIGDDYFKEGFGGVYFLAWTTTPWTLPSNTALAVGAKIDYIRVQTFNQYTGEPIMIVMAEELFLKHFRYDSENIILSMSNNPVTAAFGSNSNNELHYDSNLKPYSVWSRSNSFKGSDLVGIQYEQLLPYVKIEGKAFEVVSDNFVTTEDGTGIVHIAPTFGADDKRVADENKIVPATIKNSQLSLESTTKKKQKPLETEYNSFHSAILSGATQSHIIISENEDLKKGIGNLSWDEFNNLSFDDLDDITWNNITKDYVENFKKDKELDKINKEQFNLAWKNLKENLSVPLVDLQGKFRPEISDGIFLYGNEYVKEEYLSEAEKLEEFKEQKEILEREGKIKDLNEYLNVDKRIVLKLQEEGKLFKKETYQHSYPHCWRTDKPILYYPLDSWFIKTTAVKERMIALNKTINWKPESTGTGRFGNWLENLNDWNLSRSRYWGIPIPIWRTETGDEEVCISSVDQLKTEIEKSMAAGFMTNNPLADFEIGNMDKANYDKFDLHKNYVDNIVLVAASGKPMKRETDLIDVWFDSGSMPTAQVHYPFENKDLIDKQQLGVADFIAEGVDQTRGWFFTLHAIATMVFDHVAYKNVVSNGLVLDKNGQKMSKRLGNAVDPFETLDKYGPDATRWYMITNAQPWDNLKFDLEGITEVQRKFFGTLYNTYGFFALYANLDKFTYAEAEVPIAKRPEIDRWIISKLNSLIKDVDAAYYSYEPTRAGRAIQEFVNDHLSNWYVRLCRRRFWKGDYSEDKIAAYQTLYTCLEVVAQLASPIAPFYADKLYTDLSSISGKGNTTSVHLSDFPTVNESVIDTDLEQRMDIAQQVSSMVLSLRKKEQIKVRQPLQKLMIPILNSTFKRQLQEVADLILSEVNVKEIEYLEDSSGVLVKSIKPNFKTLGPKYGKIMKQIAVQVNQFNQNDIQEFERNQGATITVEGQQVELDSNDVEIITQDIPGWLVQTEGGLTVALDITISKALKEEGIAREFVNRIQNLRKDSGFEVTDKIALKILQHNEINEAINNNKNYICTETLTSRLDVVSELNEGVSVEIDQNLSTLIAIEKFN